MGVYIPYTRLPSAYQEVEYIQSSGTQWIDTGVTATQNTISKIKFMSLEYTGDVIYGMYNGNDNADYRLFNGYNGTPASDNIGACIFDFNSSRIQSGTGVLNTNQIFELELGNYYVKDLTTGTNIVSGTAISSYTSSRTITLNNYNNSTYPKTRWYYVKMWEGATQIRDLVPCYRIADGVIGMYDLVNNTFYTNSGTGTFTKGADVIPELKNAYIGEYRVPGENTIAYYPLISDIKDYSGNGHNGTIIGNSGSFQTIGGKQAYKFWFSGGGSSAGMDTRIDTGITRYQYPITISLWYYFLGASDRTTMISNSSGNNPNCYGIRLGGDGTFYALVGNGENNTNVSATTNNWRNVVLTVKSGYSACYLNGSLIWSANSGANASNYSTFKIGYFGLQNTSTGYYHYGWNGYLADVILEDKARTAQEVSDYYNSTKSNYGL